VSVGALGQTIGVNTQITGLSAGTTYHFAIVAQSAAGTVYGQDQTVTLVEANPPSVLVPQFDAPFRLDLNGKPVMVEQGSPEDIGAQIYNVLSCVQGAKLNDPSFGVPSPLFGPIPINLSAMIKAIQAQVPGANVSAIQESVGSFQNVMFDEPIFPSDNLYPSEGLFPGDVIVEKSGTLDSSTADVTFIAEVGSQNAT
jgi:hypothetical protein